MTHASEIQKITRQYNHIIEQRFNKKLDSLCNSISVAIEERANKGKTTYITRIKDKRLGETVMKCFAKNGYDVYKWYFGLIKITWE